MDQSLRNSTFTTKSIPKFRCPSCKTGSLIAEEDQLQVVEPAYSKAAHSSSDWEPDWQTERFNIRFECDDSSCGEYAFLMGETAVIEVYEDEGDSYGLMSVLIPKAIFPAPMVISLPDGTPMEVVKEVAAASSLIWTDLDAAANRLRTSVERLLDHLKVPKSEIKSGQQKRLSLHRRIEHFGVSQPDHKESLLALKIVGNLGSHGDTVSRKVLFDAFEVFEYSLEELLGLRKSHIEMIRKKIIDNEGNY